MRRPKNQTDAGRTARPGAATCRALSVATVVGLVCAASPATSALAQSATPGGMPPPAGMSLAQSAAMRFPQPVRVGDLLQRRVLRPVESQAILGTVREVVRDQAGDLLVVMSFGGVLGVGQRMIAVPLDAMSLLGDVMEVVALTPEQLRALPTFLPRGTVPLAADAVVKVGLAKPSH